MNTETIPFIYIILPVYNGGSFFIQQLDSIRCQEYTNWNLVIINDGSTDDTGKIIEEYITYYHLEDKIVVLTQENMGQYAACGVGLKYVREVCKGKYDNIFIAYCDADDIWTKNKLSFQVKYMENHPWCDLSYHDCWLINQNDEIIGASSLLYFASGHAKKNVNNFFEIGLGQCMISTTMMFKAEFIEDILPLPDFMSQDWWVSLCISAVYGKISMIENSLGYYRITENSSLGKKRKKPYVYFLERLVKTFEFLEDVESFRGNSEFGVRGKHPDVGYLLSYWENRVAFEQKKVSSFKQMVICCIKFPKIFFYLVKNKMVVLRYKNFGFLGKAKTLYGKSYYKG